MWIDGCHFAEAVVERERFEERRVLDFTFRVWRRSGEVMEVVI